jgi:hypothetical protein
MVQRQAEMDREAVVEQLAHARLHESSNLLCPHQVGFEGLWVGPPTCATSAR